MSSHKDGFADVSEGSITLHPIGYVRSPYAEKQDAPRQPAAARGVRGRIELTSGRGFEHAVEDLETWEYIWVLFVFDRNEGWRPKVLPPRSTGKRRGLFSTRSPHRPNPIGLSVVRLEKVVGLTIFIADLDILDGTPVLDIKPYVAYTDAIPSANRGWLDEDGARPGESAAAANRDVTESKAAHAAESSTEGAECFGGHRDADEKAASFTVHFEPAAETQVGWLWREHAIDVRSPVVRTLSLGPQPHAYRRIRVDGDGFRLAWKEWRIAFHVEGKTVRVTAITSGYRSREIALGSAPPVHAAYLTMFGTARR